MFEFDDPHDDEQNRPAADAHLHQTGSTGQTPYVIQYPPQKNNGLVLIMVVIASIFAGLWLREKFGPILDIEPKPRPGSKAVGIFYNDEDFPKYSQDQRDVLNSTKVLDALGQTPWIKIDEDDITTALDPIFEPLIELHKPKLPCIVISTGRKLVSDEIKDEEQVLELLKENL